MTCNAVRTSPFVTFISENGKDMLESTNKLADLIASAFDLIQQAFEKTYTSLTSGINFCKTTIGVTSIVSLFLAIYKFCTKDFWQTSSWLAISSHTTLIIQKAASAITFIDHLKPASLGKALTPLNYVGTVAGIVSSTFDLAEQSRVIHYSKKTTQKLTGELSKWRSILANSTLFDKDEKACAYKIFNERISFLKEKLSEVEEDGLLDADQKKTIKTKLNKKLTQYKALHKCKDLEQIKSFCKHKITHLNARKQNERNTRANAWIGIAVDIAFIALFIISLAIPIPGLLFISLGIAGFTLLASSLDLTALIAGKILPQISYVKQTLPI